MRHIYQAGEFDRRIKLYKRTESQSSTGAIGHGYQLIAENVPAKKRQFRGYERISAGQPAETFDVVVTIRYQPGIEYQDRFEVDNQTFDIDDIVELGRRQFLELIGRYVKK